MEDKQMDSISVVADQKETKEKMNKIDLQEMATLRKKDSQLQVNLFLDDSLLYLRSNQRKCVRFQTDKSDKPINTLNSMLFDGTLIESNESELSESEINEVRQFVNNNKKALDALSEMEIEIDDFKKIMIPGCLEVSDDQYIDMLGNLKAAIQEPKIVYFEHKFTRDEDKDVVYEYVSKKLKERMYNKIYEEFNDNKES